MTAICAVQARAPAAFVVLLLSACATTPSAPRNDYTERLTTSLVVMIPLGGLFDDFAAKDSTWPLNGKDSKATPEQLGCLRRQLSGDGYRRTRRTQAEAYVKSHPANIKEEVELLEGGAAETYGKLINAGIEAKKSGAHADSAAVLKSMSSDQILSFVEFTKNPGYADLRKLAGIGEALSNVESRKEGSNAGKQVGSAIASQYIFQAIADCKVPPSVYL